MVFLVRTIIRWAFASSRFEGILDFGMRPRFSAQETVMPIGGKLRRLAGRRVRGNVRNPLWGQCLANF